jgi:hypothetical protein
MKKCTGRSTAADRRACSFTQSTQQQGANQELQGTFSHFASEMKQMMTCASNSLTFNTFLAPIGTCNCTVEEWTNSNLA